MKAVDALEAKHLDTVYTLPACAANYVPAILELSKEMRGLRLENRELLKRLQKLEQGRIETVDISNDQPGS